jgi:hypothetical protein
MSLYTLLRSGSILDSLSQQRGFTVCATVLQILLIILTEELLLVQLTLTSFSDFRSQTVFGTPLQTSPQQQSSFMS